MARKYMAHECSAKPKELSSKQGRNKIQEHFWAVSIYADFWPEY